MSDDTAINTWLMPRLPEAYVNDDGDVIVEKVGKKVQNGVLVDDTYEVNFTTLFRGAPRRTGNLEILLIEAELYAETGRAENAAIPIDEETEAEARKQIEERGLEPAWEAVR